jgi:phospholipid/cholesterol/gamma-HCH transport system substrate-binding protein
VYESRRQDILLGLFALLVLGALVVLSLKVGSAAPADAVRYDFLMDSALGLQRDNRVTVAGVNVGIVDRIVVDGKRARVTVALEPSLEVREGARAAVRARTLLGEKHVDLDPGSPDAPPLPPGSTVDDNVPTVEIDAVIRGAAALVDSLNSVTPTLKNASARLDEVLGTADARKLTRDLGAIVTEFAQFMQLVERSVRESSHDVQILLRDLRTRGPDIVTRMDQAADKLNKVLDAMPMETLQATLKKTPAALDTTTQAMQDLRMALTDLRSTNVRTAKVLENLDRMLTKVNTMSEPQLREILQVEGIRVNLITDPDIERRVRALRPPAPPRPK